MLDSRRRFPSDYLLINMETAVCNEKPNSQSEKEYSEKLNESMNNVLLEEPSVNISANLPLTEALPAVLPKRQRKRARSSGAKVINKFDPVQSLDILVNPVESHVQRSHAPNLDDSDLCCLKGTLSVENITPEKKNCVQYLGRDEHHNASLGTDTLMDEPSMSIISDLVPAELPPQGGLTNRKRKKKDTIGVALESKNSCPESCAVICTAISEKEEQQEDLFHERKKKRKKQDKRHKIRESDDKNCDISVGTSLAETIMPTVDHSVEPSVVDFPEQVEQVAMAQPPMEGVGTNENSKIAKPIKDLSSSRKKKKKTRKKSKTQESNDESCRNDRSCELSVGISLVESIMPGRDLPQQPPVSESSKQKLELPQPLMEGMSMKINSESSEPTEDLSSSRKKKKKTRKKSETRESNDESCGNDKSCELSVGISLVENIMPGRDLPQQPPVSESSKQKLELPKPLMEGMSMKINSESSELIEDLSSSRKKKKKTLKKSETQESNDESCGNDKSCELSVGISLVENIMPGRDLPQQPPVSESSKQKLELPKPLMEGMSTKINSESSELIEDLSSSRKKKKKTLKKSETRESNDEGCGNDKSYELSVGISSVENIMPGVHPPQQPPVSESSKQKLELPQPLMEGISAKINSESSEPIGDLSSSRTKKKKFKTRESNDKSCELSVGIPFVENFMPGIDPSQQPPDSEFSEEKVDLPQPLVEGNSAAASSEGPKSRTVDLSCSQEQKKKKRKRRHKTNECIDERYDLSVGTSLGGNTFPGVDLTVQPPVTMFSKQDLEVEKPLVEGIRQRINSESIELIEVLSCSQGRKERKKRLKMRKSNDTSSDPSVGTLVEKIIPGADPSPQPPVAVASDLDVIQLLLKESTLQEKNEDNDQNKRSNASGNNNTNHQVCAGFPGQVDLGAVAKEGSRSQIPNWAVERPLVSVSKKKLLILDVNGLLADIVQLVPQQIKLYKPDTMISRKSVFKRPFYDSFLLFCFDYFNVAIWSSRNKKNVDEVVDYLLGISKKKLLFCWNQSHCTKTKFKTLDNEKKPLVLKELRKLWEKHDPDLPLARGEYNETNTLLVDDSPYKALCNPENTAIFPFPYHFKNRMDRSLGVGGNIRRYLEGLVYAPNVQEYVNHHRFGQGPITENAKSWEFYSQVLEDQARSPKN
ncbi:uncharacterized protein LOC126598860 isoform X6 [Malus sylvestris]|uniref:uncharacterized protein LOC126598860 isoform X6 n=1 Tax=Malus sylvestris TaxID=3752 RepID=UPI0021ACB978|nr:uncharacterized protein LOC126598860 isoform X6 [Malus sylvestris]